MIGMLRRREMMAQSKSILPSEYQQVEYIKSTGTQSIQISIDFDVHRSIYQYRMMNERGATAGLFGQATYFFDLYEGTSYTFRLGSWNGTVVRIIDNNLKNNIVSVELVCDIPNYTMSYYNEGTLFNTTDSGTSNYSVVPNSFSLFYVQHYPFVGRLYSFLIKDLSQNTIHDFIPCYRKADNVAGMYDIVNGVFYTNAGTGEFTVGPNV